MPAAVLEARSIVKEYPGVRALDGVDFELVGGEIHALLGENGAGKSTLVNILTGAVRPDAGSVLVRGEEVEFTTPRDAVDRGVAVIHQDMAFAPDLDVATTICLDDIPVRQDRLGRWFGVIDRSAVAERASRALDLVRNPVRAAQPSGSLSVAQGQLVQIARALSSRGLAMLLLDEPTASLSPSERDELFEHLRELRGMGIGILYISHRLEEVVQLADRATVLRDGKVVGSVERGKLSVERVAGLMLGTSRVLQERARTHQLGPPALRVIGLTREPEFRDVSFDVRTGEIVGLTGLVGAGRTEVARCIFGVDPLEGGEIEVGGRAVNPRSPAEAINLGMGFATEDRKSQGVFFWLPVTDNLVMSSLTRSTTARALLSWRQWLRRGAMYRLAKRVVEQLGIRPSNPSTLVGTMSGGNQQKVILGRWLTSQSPVLLLDEPTRGVDVGAKSDIWNLIHGLARDRAAVLAISSEVPELLAHADRILVMKDGELVGELAHDEATEEEVMLLAGGSN